MGPGTESGFKAPEAVVGVPKVEVPTTPATPVEHAATIADTGAAAPFGSEERQSAIADISDLDLSQDGATPSDASEGVTNTAGENKEPFDPVKFDAEQNEKKRQMGNAILGVDADTVLPTVDDNRDQYTTTTSKADGSTPVDESTLRNMQKNGVLEGPATRDEHTGSTTSTDTVGDGVADKLHAAGEDGPIMRDHSEDGGRGAEGVSPTVSSAEEPTPSDGSDADTTKPNEEKLETEEERKARIDQELQQMREAQQRGKSLDEQVQDGDITREEAVQIRARQAEAAKPEQPPATPPRTDEEYTKRLEDIAAEGPIVREHTEDVGRGAEGVPPTPPTEAEKQTTQPADTEAAKQQLVAERDTLLANNNLTAEQAKRVQEINKELNKDPQAQEKARQAAREKAIRGEELTDDEVAALASETEGTDPSAENNEEKLKQEFDKLREEAMDALLKGDPEKAAEAFVEYNKKLAESMNFQLDENMARAYLNEVMSPEKAKSPQETAKMRAIRQELIKLAQIEQQIRSQAEVVKHMETEVQKRKQEVNEAEGAYLNEQNQDEKEKKLMIFSQKAMRLATYEEAVNVQKRLGRDSIVDRRQALGQIHRKLGTKSLAGNLAFGAGTAIRQVGYGVANDYDSLMSVFD